MRLILKKLIEVNFKGNQRFEIEFDDITNIHGANRSGKTSAIADAYSWLLTGKDTADRKDYQIKNTKKMELNRGEHSVEGFFERDGFDLTLKRVFTERWETPRGSETPEMRGHKTTFFINGAPKLETEYNAFISELVSERILKILTNPLYFPNMPWQDQRLILTELAGDISHEVVIARMEAKNPNKDYKEFAKALKGHATVNDFKKHLTYQIDTFKKKQITIPSKIEELTRMRPEEVDMEALKSEISRLEVDIEKIETQIRDKVAAQNTENETVMGVQSQINTLKTANNKTVFQTETEYTTDVNERKREVTNLKNELSVITEDLASKNNLLAKLNSDRDSIQKQKDAELKRWYEENESLPVINPESFKCDYCQTPFTPEKVDEQKGKIVEAFNNRKALTLSNINENGKRLSGEYSRLSTRIEELKSEIETIDQKKVAAQDKLKAAEERANSQETVLSVKERLDSNSEYQSNLVKIAELTKTITDRPAINFDDLKNEKYDLTRLLDAEKFKLNTNEDIKKIDSRIEELKAEEKNIGSEIAKLERDVFMIQEYIIARTDAIEFLVNDRFSFVTFKLFERQINGGIKDCCEIIYDQVPFSTLNTEAKLNAGLDVVNTISKHFNVFIPVILDNRESVSEIIPVQTQVINLFVDPKCKKLTKK